MLFRRQDNFQLDVMHTSNGIVVNEYDRRYAENNFLSPFRDNFSYHRPSCTSADLLLQYSSDSNITNYANFNSRCIPFASTSSYGMPSSSRVFISRENASNMTPITADVQKAFATHLSTTYSSCTMNVDHPSETPLIMSHRVVPFPRRFPSDSNASSALLKKQTLTATTDQNHISPTTIRLHSTTSDNNFLYHSALLPHRLSPAQYSSSTMSDYGIIKRRKSKLLSGVNRV